MENNILLCSCHSAEHQIILHSSTDPIYGPEAYLEIHLIKRSFWYRLKYGLKSIFGYKSRYGAWDEFILDRSHAASICKLAEHLDK